MTGGGAAERRAGITLITATANGRRHAQHAATALEGSALADSRPAEAVATAWRSSEAMVLFMAAGAAVRLIAPHLGDKRTDPAVVAVDDAASYAIALAGGHHGANDLARRVADALGAEAVVTTASEVMGAPALDHLGQRFGLRVDPDCADLAAVGAALVGGETVHLWRSRAWPTGPLPATVELAQRPTAPGIVITDELIDPPRPSVLYRPRSLRVGVGSSSGVSAEEIGELIDAALAQADLSPGSVAAVATVQAKAGERGILEAAAARGWPIVVHSAETLAGIGVPNPSQIVADSVGTPSVAEAAALAEGGELIVAKRKSANATVAIARSPVRGRLALVSTGPGDAALVPPMARDALAAAEVVIGLDQYVERVRGWVRPGSEILSSPIGDEVARAESAVAAARAGRSVALLSGGDVGVYAMASPALERLGDGAPDPDVVVVPGVTAATAAAAVLGSPLGHDHCAISLSDLLTPWAVIRRRLKAAAEGDFVVSLYNPRSAGRAWQLDEARLLLGEHRKPDTPVGVVTDAFRPGQQVTLTTLGDLDPQIVGMRTIVVIGNSQTRMTGGRMITPRGYE
ncbi:MAG TPA: precorrin-3B C(17)-methyltransferase [Egibacteraceae bacterium]|nr:precorrin-3B C(17)-methyltransferase [Egibacteraceae bacterium]